MKLFVREAREEDFDSIYSLLKELNSTTLCKNDWKKITQSYFPAPKETYGYVLVEEDETVVGFLGTIFSEREIQGKSYNFCNIHSWIVSPKAKSGGINLLMKVLRLKNHVITNFTASAVPYQIFKSLKFKEVFYTNYKLLPLQKFSFRNSSVSIDSITATNADQLLSSSDLKIYKAHAAFKNVDVLRVGSSTDYAMVISKKKPYLPGPLARIPFLKEKLVKRLFLAQIHYLTNSSLFFSTFAQTGSALSICAKLGVAGLIVSDNFLPIGAKAHKTLYPSKRPFLYKHDEISEQLIDTLFSELFILNL
jgi:hypothetical protein